MLLSLNTKQLYIIMLHLWLPTLGVDYKLGQHLGASKSN